MDVIAEEQNDNKKLCGKHDIYSIALGLCTCRGNGCDLHNIDRIPDHSYTLIKTHPNAYQDDRHISMSAIK